MTLPVIPDEAWNAASDQTGQPYVVIRPIVEAVAPHLYAAFMLDLAENMEASAQAVIRRHQLWTSGTARSRSKKLVAGHGSAALLSIAKDLRRMATEALS